MDVDFLLSCLDAHPLAEPVDAVKLLYQSEFGCGHLLPDEDVCAERIRSELEQTVAVGEESAFEPIGNGLCRLNLRHPSVRALPPERIARMMRVTDTQVHGSQRRFLDTIQLLRSLTDRAGATDRFLGADRLENRSRLPFSLHALDAYLSGDWRATLPPSHSARYREAYRPAYRVVLRRFGEALPLMIALESHLRERGKATLAMDGDCASGKTTLIALLAPLYDANVLHMDDFFLPFSMHTPQRMAEPGGNVHYERFREQALKGLLAGEAFTYEAFDCHKGVSHSAEITPKPVTLIEGSYALHPYFDAEYATLHAVRVLMTVDRQEQHRRIMRRNGAAMLERFRNEWIPLEIQYFEAYHSARKDEIELRSERHAEDELPGGEDTL